MLEHARTLAIAGALVTMLAAPAAAQESRVGLFGGGTWFSSLTPGGPEDVALSNGWVTGVQGEHWLGLGRWGVRGRASFTERAYDFSAEADILFYMMDMGVMFRPLPATADRLVEPFLSAGMGAGYMRFGNRRKQFLPGESWMDNGVLRGSLVLGAGVDVLPRDRAGLRIELADHLAWRSPAEHMEHAYGAVHQVRLETGVHVGLGQIPMPRFLVREAPAPAPLAATAATAADARAAAETPGRVHALEARVAALEDSIARMSPELRGSAPESMGARAPLYTVQVAAFREFSRSDADLIAVRLMTAGLPVWIATVHPSERDAQYLVRIGAASSEREATALARRIAGEHGWPVWVTPIAVSDDVPNDVLRLTRGYLERQPAAAPAQVTP